MSGFPLNGWPIFEATCWNSSLWHSFVFLQENMTFAWKKRHAARDTSVNQTNQHETLQPTLTGRGNATHYTGLTFFSDEKQGTNAQSSPLLQLSGSLLHFLRSKPLVAVVRRHGLHKEKRWRVQNGNWVATHQATHTHQPYPQTQRTPSNLEESCSDG